MTIRYSYWHIIANELSFYALNGLIHAAGDPTGFFQQPIRHTFQFAMYNVPSTEPLLQISHIIHFYLKLLRSPKVKPDGPFWLLSVNESFLMCSFNGILLCQLAGVFFHLIHLYNPTQYPCFSSCPSGDEFIYLLLILFYYIFME